MFNFSLQTALEVREREEKMRMKDLAEKLSIEREIQKKIDQDRQKISQSDQNLNEAKREGVFTIDHMRRVVQFKERKKRDIILLNQQLDSAKEEVALQQQILLEARRRKRTMEILKDREYKRYWEKLAKQEQHFMDEVAGTMSYQRRSN